jgi:hypothetical protein
MGDTAAAVQRASSAMGVSVDQFVDEVLTESLNRSSA